MAWVLGLRISRLWVWGIRVQGWGLGVGGLGHKNLGCEVWIYILCYLTKGEPTATRVRRMWGHRTSTPPSRDTQQPSCRHQHHQQQQQQQQHPAHWPTRASKPPSATSPPPSLPPPPPSPSLKQHQHRHQERARTMTAECCYCCCCCCCCCCYCCCQWCSRLQPQDTHSTRTPGGGRGGGT